MTVSEPKRVLIIRLSAIGDVVFASPSKAIHNCIKLLDPKYSQKRRLRNALNPIGFRVSNEYRNQRREFF